MPSNQNGKLRQEGTTYGFRPGRSCHDAVVRIYNFTRANSRRKWVIDADICAAFDEINQEFLLKRLNAFPARALIRQWLKAGYVEYGHLYETEAGVPQGSPVSPLLANIARHGMESALGITYNHQGYSQSPRGVVKYADDFTVFCETREDAQKCLELLSEWLALRGLSLSVEKTRITHLTEGFDFLGFHFQHYPREHTPTGWKLLITPSRQSVQKLRTKLRSEWLKLRGHNLPAVLKRLNPKIRGWANYFRIACSSKVFNKLDSWMFHRQIRWGKYAHPTKPWKWLENRYWGRFNLNRKDNWVFGDKHSGAYLLKFSWFSIQRHVLVKGRASPDDPSRREYWQKREKAQAKTLMPSYRKIAQKQAHKCPICGESLYNGELIQRHHIKPKSKSGKDSYKNLQLVHLYCHQQLHATEDVNS